MTRSCQTASALQADTFTLLSRGSRSVSLFIFQVLDTVFAGAITALSILDIKLLSFRDDTRLLESLSLAASDSILESRNHGRMVDLEAEDLRLIPTAGLGRHQSRIDLEENVVERRAKVRAVDAGVAAGFRVVDVLALGAVELDGLEAGIVARALGQQRVRFAHDAWAAAKVGFLELLDHLGEAAGRDDVACVDEAVEVAGGLLNRLAHVVFAVEVEDVGDQVQGVLVVVDLCVQAGEVETVGDVFFVDLTEVLVATG